MAKSKIAISISKSLLNVIDQYTDSNIIMSRSHAIEYLIKKALKNEPINTAIILVHENHHHHMSYNYKNKTLLENNINFFEKFGIQNIYLITKNANKFNHLKFSGINFKVVEEKICNGTGNAINIIKDKLPHTFIVLNGDTFNDFNLQEMIKAHLNNDAMATIGLTSLDKPEMRGSVTLNGNAIIDFKEKQPTKSFIINAGIYILNSEIFNYFTKNTKSIESDIFPKLAKEKKLQGYFTYGTFIHAPDVNKQK